MPRSKSTLPFPMFRSYSTRVVRPRSERRRILPRRSPAILAETGRCGLIETDVGLLRVHAEQHASPWSASCLEGHFWAGGDLISQNRDRFLRPAHAPVSQLGPQVLRCLGTGVSGHRIPDREFSDSRTESIGQRKDDDAGQAFDEGPGTERSEERRVGKEGRWRLAPWR